MVDAVDTEALRARCDALEGAFETARNRLQWAAVQSDFVETTGFQLREWADEATAALALHRGETKAATATAMPAPAPADDVDEAFHLVWCPTGPHAPRYRHSAFDRADAEARRLARENPGSEFFVLTASRRVVFGGLNVTDLIAPDDLPF